MRGALLGLWVLASAGVAWGSESPPEAARTRLDEEVLDRSDLVVLGSLTDVRGARGPQIAQLVIERVVYGEVPAGNSRRVTLAARGFSGRGSAQTPAPPSFGPQLQGRRVFFLAQQGGVVFEVVNSFSAEGAEAPAKLAALEELLRIRSTPDARGRNEALVAWLLDAAGQSDAWTQVFAARELEHLARQRPDLLQGERRERLDHLLSQRRPRLVTRWLEEARSHLAGGGESPSGRPGSATRAAEAALLKAMERRDESLALAKWGLLGEERRIALIRGCPTSRLLRAFLKSRYAGEDSLEVRAEMIRHLGLHGGPDDVAWLEARLANSALRPAALLALWRVSDPSAREVLQRWRARLEESEDPVDRDLARWTQHLLGHPF